MCEKDLTTLRYRDVISWHWYDVDNSKNREKIAKEIAKTIRKKYRVLKTGK